MGKDPDQIRREIEDTRERMGGTVDAIAYKADVPGRVKDSISDKVDGVKAAIADTAGRVGSAVGATASKVSDAVPDGDDVREGATRVREGATRTVGMIKENPLGVLLGGIAVGFVIGSLLPSTGIEDEKLGEIKENLKSQVQDAGGYAVEHGRAVLRDTAAAAQASVHEHGAQLADETRDAMQRSSPNGS
ncbi:MAG: DUF3618 domain-containing protein [Candidatus Eremiobacteraeota bacterium]|nr:DUF3618 domain-containing protein [Candidatus Eremiobacteraeota bacterium]